VAFITYTYAPKYTAMLLSPYLRFKKYGLAAYSFGDKRADWLLKLYSARLYQHSCQKHRLVTLRRVDFFPKSLKLSSSKPSAANGCHAPCLRRKSKTEEKGNAVGA
jgi:hypothetical protein